MRTTIIAAAAGLVILAAGCASHAPVIPAAHTSTVAAASAPHLARACPAATRAITKVASQAGIDLQSGSMNTITITRQMRFQWSDEISASYPRHAYAKPTAADVKLQELIVVASIHAMEVTTTAAAVTFINDLQAIQAACA